MERVGLSAALSRVVSVSAPCSEVSPSTFLRAAEGEARGFWARGEHWVAHLGVVAEVTAAPATSGVGGRFQAVRSGADELLGSAAPGECGPRLYGGFAFRGDHRQAGFWHGFPTALFHLPSIEASGGGGSVTLRAHALVGLGDDRSEVERDLGERLERFSRTLAHAPVREPTGEQTVAVDRSDSDRSSWETAISASLCAIREGSVSKVVLARTLDLESRGRLRPVEVLEHLWDRNRATHVFLFEPRPGAALLGAAPETVATLRHGSFQATAVAGSIGVGTTAEERGALAEGLLSSVKDREEHRIALDDMVIRLTPLAEEVEAQPEPHVLTLSRIQHLESKIEARIPDGVGVLDVLEALHPTPAVCGFPRDAALELLSRQEPFERGWYAGPVGWFDAAGNGVFAPALRCAVVRDGKWRLFAGAGIVSGSDAALEWEETEIKFEPVLRALESSGASL
ncbi:MAG: isochorismate synthase MenF [Gemmatimonadota bacterium]|nr:MAG: isochorismate synthase MenF [Gemmatimonadota bacterium]